jgi:hypothetical protein
MQGLIWGPPKAVAQNLILPINILRRQLASLHLQPVCTNRPTYRRTFAVAAQSRIVALRATTPKQLVDFVTDL